MIKIIKNKQILISRAATSCGTQGEAGKDGAQGATGAQGAQGEKGDKGDKGDTSYEVIVLGATGGTISLKDGESYTGIKGDSRTLVFTPTTAGQIVTTLTINYEEVALTDEILNGSYKLTFADQSFIVSAEFDSVENYGVSLLNDYYDALVKADNQLKLRSGTELASEKRGSYYDSTLLNTTLKAGTDSVKAIVKAFTKDEAIGDKVSAIKTGVSSAEKKIDEAYAKLIKDAKAAAKVEASGLYNAGVALSSTDYFITADRAAMLKKVNDEIDAAKTLADVSALVDSKSSLTTKGSYNLLETNRSSAKTAISGALSGITGEPFGADDAEDLADLKEQLAVYDVSIDKLPSEVAAEWLAKLSAAQSLDVYAADPADGSSETYSKGDVVMGYEGAKAVTESYSSVKTALQAAILETYKKEINSAKSLATTEAKNTLIGIVDGAIGEWVKDTTGTKTLSDYVSADGGTIAGGLIAYIETKLSAAITANYVAFGQERLQNALDETYKGFAAEVKEVKEDSVYNSLLAPSAKLTSGTNANKYQMLKVVGKKTTTPAIDTTLANPLYVAMSETEDSKGYVYLDTLPTETAATITSGVTSGVLPTAVPTTVTTYNVNTLLKAMVNVAADGSVTADTTASGKLNALTTVKDIKKAATDYAGIFKKLRNAAVEKYSDLQIASVITDTDYPSTNVYVSKTGVTSIYKGMLPQVTTGTGVDYSATTFTNVSDSIYDIKANKALFSALEADVKDWVIATNDNGIEDASNNLKTSTKMYKAAFDSTDATSIISKILSGSITTTEAVQDAVDGLDKIYEAGVAEYLTNAEGLVDKYYTNLINDTTITVDLYNTYTSIYNNVKDHFTYDATNSATLKSLLKGTGFDYLTIIAGSKYESIDEFIKLVYKVFGMKSETLALSSTASKSFGLMSAKYEMDTTDTNKIKSETTIADADRKLAAEILILVDQGIVSYDTTDTNAKKMLVAIVANSVAA